MKLAISNIGWEASNDEKVYELMKIYGFAGLEIAPTRIFPENPYDKNDAARDFAANLYKEYGFVIPSMQSIWFGKSENIFASKDDYNALVDYTKKTVDFAQSVGCKNLVFGCPRNRNVPDGADSSVAVDFFKILGDYANEHSTVIGMEANPPIYNTNYINDTASALELIDKVGSKGFLLNLDLGTMIYNDEKINVICNKVKYINHVHISEPYLKVVEKRDIHKELVNVLEAEGYDGFVSIEMGKGNDMDVIKSVMEYVKELFK